MSFVINIIPFSSLFFIYFLHMIQSTFYELFCWFGILMRLLILAAARIYLTSQIMNTHSNINGTHLSFQLLQSLQENWQ